jgi:hypothetical protein
MSTRKHGARTGHRLKVLPAAKIRGGQIIEWAERRWRVSFVEPCYRGQHPRQRGSHRPAFVLHVCEVGWDHEPMTLHYFADEDVTVCGWSFGATGPRSTERRIL